MKLPRDVGGEELARRLKKYGYSITRQTGSHMRLTSTVRGTEHHITVPLHDSIKVGTLNGILNEVAAYLDVERQKLTEELFS